MKLRSKSTYFKLGLTIFIAGCALIVFFFTAQTVGDLTKYIAIVVDVLKPFIIGFVLAYLMCPVYNACVRRLRHMLSKKLTDQRRIMRIAKGVSLIVTFLLLIAIIAGLLYLVIPQMVDSIAGLVVVLPDYFDKVIDWMQTKAQVYPQIWYPIENAVSNSNDKIMAWLTDKVLPASMDMVDSITAGVASVVSVFLNILIGLVSMIYMLGSKDVFTAQSRKLCYATMKKEHADRVITGAHNVNHTFGKFVSGNLLDSLIIGVLCFIFMAIMGWPYAVLVSVIVGVTNFIPFFGPFIGGIPSALLLCTDNIWTGIYFGIFTVVLQQVDGNVIKPKVLGESIGLPSFWVMFSIVVGGGLFGFMGMILAVPVFALIWSYAGYRMNMKLDRYNLATELDDYMDKDIYNLREVKIFSRFRKKQRKAEEKSDDNSEDN